MESLNSKIGFINVTSLVEAQTSYHQYQAIISIEDPDCVGNRVIGDVPQLILPFHDVTKLSARWTAPSVVHVEAALDFASQYRDERLLIYCHAGISRSSAVALAVIADRLGPGNEQQAVEYLFSTFKNIDPNSRVVACADNVLERDRALTTAFRNKLKQVKSERGDNTFSW